LVGGRLDLARALDLGRRHRARLDEAVEVRGDVHPARGGAEVACHRLVVAAALDELPSQGV
jgi:hypothetical protein